MKWGNSTLGLSIRRLMDVMKFCFIDMRFSPGQGCRVAVHLHDCPTGAIPQGHRSVSGGVAEALTTAIRCGADSVCLVDGHGSATRLSTKQYRDDYYVTE